MLALTFFPRHDTQANGIPRYRIYPRRVARCDPGASRRRIPIAAAHPSGYGRPCGREARQGSRVSYSFENLWEMHLALLLEHFGLPPARVKFVLEERVGWLGWYDKMREKKKLTTADIWVHMRYFSKNLEDGSPAPVTLIAPFDEIVRAIERLDKEQPTAVIGLINLSKVTRECESAILKHVQ
jgi:hypothetical protein